MDAKIDTREPNQKHNNRRDGQHVNFHAPPFLYARQEDAKGKIRNRGHCRMATREAERVHIDQM